MTATFLVTLELEAITPELLAVESDNMADALESAGFPVVSVAPWHRPSMPISPSIGTVPPRDNFQPPTP